MSLKFLLSKSSITLHHSGDCSNVSLIVSAVVDVLVSEEGQLFHFDSYNKSFSSVVKGLRGMFIIDLDPIPTPFAIKFNGYYGKMNPSFEKNIGAAHLTFPDLT
jgi:hypothetical protein